MLSGTVPRSLALLTQLSYLSLCENLFSGELDLSSPSAVWVSNAGLAGTIATTTSVLTAGTYVRTWIETGIICRPIVLLPCQEDSLNTARLCLLPRFLLSMSQCGISLSQCSVGFYCTPNSLSVVANPCPAGAKYNNIMAY